MNRITSWWKFVTCCPGPEQLSRLFLLGVAIAFCSFLLIIGIGVFQGFWKEIDKSFAGERWSICQCQLQKRQNNLNEIKEKFGKLKDRKTYLEQIRSEPRNSLYDSAALGLVNNEKEMAQLQAKQKALQGESVQNSLLDLIPLLLSIVVFSWIAGRLMIWHATKAGLAIGEAGEKLVDWKRPFWILVLTFFALQEVREVISSVLAVDKNWFSWSSFCISTRAWGAGQILAFGTYLVIGYPACIIWCLSRGRYRPDLNPDAPDGAWGAGDYILFAQTWSVLVFILILAPILLWFGLVIGNVPIVYLLPPAGVLIVALAVAVRFLRHAIKIRLLYQQTLRSLGSWSKIKALGLPPDPTVGFLGAQWWNLPATILATVATFWALIQWTSLGELLKAAAGH